MVNWPTEWRKEAGEIEMKIWERCKSGEIEMKISETEGTLSQCTQLRGFVNGMAVSGSVR